MGPKGAEGALAQGARRAPWTPWVPGTPFLVSWVPSPGSQGVSIRTALARHGAGVHSERVDTERANGSAGMRGA